jgi:hypothetical protein
MQRVCEEESARMHDVVLLAIGFALGAIVASTVLMIVASGIAAGAHIKH